MKRLLHCIGFAAACALSQGAGAAVDMFGKFSGIDGESIQKGHEKWIEILAYSWGAANGGPFPPVNAQFQDFSFTKLYDSSSPPLLLNLAQGKHINEALFEFTKTTGSATPEVYLTYEFSDVFLTSYGVGGSSGGGSSSESWSFSFGKVQTTYRPQDNKTGKLGPPIIFSWDVGGKDGVPAIPEPSTWAMLMAGLLCVVYFGRNRVRGREAVA
jgi:type VI secretion system secreted protein Hcp